MSNSIIEFLKHGDEQYMPGVSVDNVIFGFHDDQLKVLLLHSLIGKVWMLPGGFIGKNEPMDKAASRILKSRTGLSEIYLQQFQAFGAVSRTGNKVLLKALESIGKKVNQDHWALQRFVTIGYFALVEYDKVNPKPDDISTACTWHSLDDLPELLMDHHDIIKKALEELRIKIRYQPIGYNLLPLEFQMKHLQSIYETILGRKLDRANFSRKILGYDILVRKKKYFGGGSHKAPYLYSFNKKKYFKALQQGLGNDF